MAVTELGICPASAASIARVGRPDPHADILGLGLQAGEADQPVRIAGRGGHFGHVQRHMLVAAAGA